MPDQAPQWIRSPGIAHVNPDELERMLCADIECDDDISAHEVQVIASSWAYVNQVWLGDSLATASWCSAGVFQRSYLRGMSSIAEGMSTLGPVVATQHVVCTWWQWWLPPPYPEQSGYSCLKYLMEITWLILGISVVGTKDRRWTSHPSSHWTLHC